MIYKQTNLMLYNRNSVNSCVPNICSVYYLRGIANETSLYPIYYIGISKPNKLRDVLIDHLSKGECQDVIYVNYIECDSYKEAKSLARREIERFNPKYNLQKSIVPSYIQRRSIGNLR